MIEPRAEYQRRLEKYQQVIAERERAHVRAGNAKLAVIAAGLVVLWLTLSRHSIPAYWIIAVVAVYAALAAWHQRVIRSRTRGETAVAFYRRGLDRIEDRWIGTGATGERFRDEKHVYAADIDLFGRGSLFELLSLARLPMGENKLAEWLLRPSAPAEILERQTLVAELRDRLDIREALAMTGEELRGTKLNPEGLMAWAEGPTVMPGAAIRALGIVLALATLGALVYTFVIQSSWPIIAALVVQSVFWRLLRARVARAIALDCDAQSLHLFADIVQRLEQEKFAADRLQKLVAGFGEGGERASQAVRGLARRMDWMEAAQTRPMGVKLLDLFVGFSIQLAYSAESWRRSAGHRMRGVIEAVGEIEALLSLAGYSFEHPEDPFPRLVEMADRGTGEFEGSELGHPLIAAAQCVRNSVRLGNEVRLLLISGSNMSGKSTLLRTVGVNVALAMAGAPVRAKTLRMTPLTLGTHLRSGDSLQEGRSNFYTEILRLRQVFDLAGGSPPLLFLFDELLEGTNSHDRRIGAETLLHAFVEHGGIGIVTTHDLVLTELEPTFGGLARNAHLEDSVEDGKMRFDYKLKEGVVTRSNALELMRLIGLKV